ncbi:hypothetical protein [Streptomyces sp. 184]|uniref:hypothetical protein n=1 Tax=Streptomyces sp. 184 TaxID=1827526 RepID=UPI0038911B14
MGFMDRIIGTPEARAAHREAKGELDRVTRRVECDSGEHVAANDRVIETEQALPKWRRG